MPRQARRWITSRSATSRKGLRIRWTGILRTWTAGSPWSSKSAEEMSATRLFSWADAAGLKRGSRLASEDRPHLSAVLPSQRSGRRTGSLPEKALARLKANVAALTRRFVPFDCATPRAFAAELDKQWPAALLLTGSGPQAIASTALCATAWLGPDPSPRETRDRVSRLTEQLKICRQLHVTEQSSPGKKK